MLKYLSLTHKCPLGENTADFTERFRLKDERDDQVFCGKAEGGAGGSFKGCRGKKPIGIGKGPDCAGGS